MVLSRSQQFRSSSTWNQVELGEWATGRIMHCAMGFHIAWSVIFFYPNIRVISCPYSNINHVNINKKHREEKSHNNLTQIF